MLAAFCMWPSKIEPQSKHMFENTWYFCYTNYRNYSFQNFSEGLLFSDFRRCLYGIYWYESDVYVHWFKSFYASVDAADLGVDPFTTPLVVSDNSRGKGAITLAISPALKKLGVKNRSRLFQIPPHIEYITVKPHMKRYMQVSAQIYGTLLEYISPEDIHVYSIDEYFIDITSYTKLYKKTPHQLAQMLLDAVLEATHIYATVGIGTNLFLAKIALDILAKHASDFIGYLDENLFKEHIWHHQPITDIWQIGSGIANRLRKFGAFDLHGITQVPEYKLYKEFGVNAELLIESCLGA